MERELCVVIGTITPFNHFGLELNFCGQTNPNPFPPLPPFNKQCGPSMWPAWNCSCLSKWVGLYMSTMRRDKKTKQNNHHKCMHTYVCVCVCVCVCTCALLCLQGVWWIFKKANNNWGKVRNMACPPTNLILQKSKFSLSLSLSPLHHKKWNIWLMSSTLLRKKNRKNIFIYLVIKWNFRVIYVKTGYLIYKLFIWFLHYLGRIGCLFMV